jgi:hypothetical protein
MRAARRSWELRSTGCSDKETAPVRVRSRPQDFSCARWVARAELLLLDWDAAGHSCFLERREDLAVVEVVDAFAIAEY